MRCPDCDAIVDIPLESEDDDRPRRRKKSGGSVVLWVLLGGAAVLVGLCGGGIYLVMRLFDTGAHESPVPLMQARAGFTTKIVNSNRTGIGAPPPPPAEKFSLVHYNSPAGALAAYVTPDRHDGKKHPAVVWCHGGFGGIGPEDWAEGSAPMIFAEAGCVVMCPSWRGENNNPGVFEMFYGEVDDALAAVDYVSGLPFVDASRVYIVGHSAGGTIALLAVEATTKLRAAFVFGGAPDIGTVIGPFGVGGFDGVTTPFQATDKKEQRLRSAIDYIHHVRTPVFYFEGEDEGYIPDALKMEKQARKGGAPVQVFEIEGGEHGDIVEPICEVLAKKIRTDAGPTCAIAVTKAEAQKAYDDGDK
jgi:acetyl esterase/lipase